MATIHKSLLVLSKMDAVCAGEMAARAKIAPAYLMVREYSVTLGIVVPRVGMTVMMSVAVALC